MSDPIGRISGSNVSNVIENGIDNNNESVKVQGDLGPKRAPNSSERNSEISFKGGVVYNNAPIPDNYKAAIESLRQDKPSNTFKFALGRAVLWIVNLFKGVKSSSSLSTTAKLEVLRGKQPNPLPDNIANKNSPYLFTNEQLGNLCGLTNGCKIKYFHNNNDDNKGYKEILFPHGEPRLSDIKQNPELQDCWFLSSISSMLQSEGVESISRLFSESKVPGNVVIRLGSNLYDVPMGRITDSSGDKFGSNSANWVIALENAMLMHQALSSETPDINNPRSVEDYKSQIRMPMRYPSEGLKALHGYKHDGAHVEFKSMDWEIHTVENGVYRISKLLELGKPVIIGHSRPNSGKIALRDGIAPGHAVTVLEVVPNGFKILDPYGQVKTLAKNSITDYVMHSIRDISEPDDKYSFLTAAPKEPEPEMQPEVKQAVENEKDDF